MRDSASYEIFLISDMAGPYLIFCKLIYHHYNRNVDSDGLETGVLAFDPNSSQKS